LSIVPFYVSLRTYEEPQQSKGTPLVSDKQNKVKVLRSLVRRQGQSEHRSYSTLSWTDINNPFFIKEHHPYLIYSL
jgi:hypothetical protein